MTKHKGDDMNTPMTEAFFATMQDWCAPFELRDFCRRLERENAELRAALREIELLAEDGSDINDSGGPNLAMKIAMEARAALAKVRQ